MKKIFALLFTVSLVGFTSCSSDDDSSEPQHEPGIITYSDVELKLVDSDYDGYGIAFSAQTGKTYKLDEITTDNISEIDVVSANNQVFVAFDSPDFHEDTKIIEGAKTTKVQIVNVEMTVEEFEALEDVSVLANLDVVPDIQARPITFKGIVLFETQEGKKGALNFKAINARRVLFDVKVME